MGHLRISDHDLWEMVDLPSRAFVKEAIDTILTMDGMEPDPHNILADILTDLLVEYGKLVREYLVATLSELPASWDEYVGTDAQPTAGPLRASRDPVEGS